MDADHIITNMFCQFCPPPFWVRWPFHLKHPLWRRCQYWRGRMSLPICPLCIVQGNSVWSEKNLYRSWKVFSVWSEKNSQCNSQKKIFSAFIKNQSLFYKFEIKTYSDWLFLPLQGIFYCSQKGKEKNELYNSSKYLQKPVSIFFLVQTCQVITMCFYCAEL